MGSLPIEHPPGDFKVKEEHGLDESSARVATCVSDGIMEVVVWEKPEPRAFYGSAEEGVPYAVEILMFKTCIMGTFCDSESEAADTALETMTAINKAWA